LAVLPDTAHAIQRLNSDAEHAASRMLEASTAHDLANLNKAAAELDLILDAMWKMDGF
jgi:hypothetical protein